MGRRFLLMSLWIAGWVAWPGAPALAAEGEGVDLEAVIQGLRAENPGLSESEARELAGLAVQDLREGEGAARDLSAGATTEQAGIITQGPSALGAPELGGGGPGFEMTPEEQALAEQVGARANELAAEGLPPEEVDRVLKEEFAKEFERFKEHERIWHDAPPGERDDARLKELYERGVPGVERAPGLEQREGLGHEPTNQEREQMERYREMGHGSREFDRPTYEREQPTPREAVERPTAETPTREMERPTHERPEGMPGY